MKTLAGVFAALAILMLAALPCGPAARAAETATAVRRNIIAVAPHVWKAQSTHSRWRSHFRWGSTGGRKRGK